MPSPSPTGRGGRGVRVWSRPLPTRHSPTRPLALYFSQMLLLALLLSATHTDSCYHYWPASVTITGRLTTRTMAGPPKYTSIAQGDRPQRVYLLILDRALCTAPDPAGAQNPDPVTGQDTIQVRADSPPYHEEIESLLGRRATLTGTLGEALTPSDRYLVHIDPTKVKRAAVTSP